MSTTAYDQRTGRPLDGQTEAVETLTDGELGAELTIAALYPVGRARRYERLWRELLNRRHTYRRQRTIET